MQDQYAGDIGDFGKIALLRHLSEGRQLGVCWYKTKGDGTKKNDGKHTSYLCRSHQFKPLELDVFDALKQIVHSPHPASRSIAALENSGLLGNAKFHDIEVPPNSYRRSWAETLIKAMATSDLIFLDPDNGIEGRRLTPKHAALDEIIALRQANRVLVVYHHQGRRKAEREAAMLAQQVRDAGWSPVELIRFRLFSSRFYVIAGHHQALSNRIAEFVIRWGIDRVEHFSPDRLLRIELELARGQA